MQPEYDDTEMSVPFNQPKDDVKTFSSGAQSSSSKAGYWMIPFVVLRAVAQRFDLGALKYDAHNWKRGCNDPAFMRDRFNHMIEHAFKFTEGGDEEDDIEGSIIAVLINAVFLTYWTIMHRKAVEAAFPTQAPATPPMAQFITATQIEERLKAPAVKLSKNTDDPMSKELWELAQKSASERRVIVPESADPTPRRNAVAFKPQPPAKLALEEVVPGIHLPNKSPVPKDTGNSQFC